MPANLSLHTDQVKYPGFRYSSELLAYLPPESDTGSIVLATDLELATGTDAGKATNVVQLKATNDNIADHKALVGESLGHLPDATTASIGSIVEVYDDAGTRKYRVAAASPFGEYQGDYSPEPDGSVDPDIAAITKSGDWLWVAQDGVFDGEALTVGQLLIAASATPAATANDWRFTTARTDLVELLNADVTSTSGAGYSKNGILSTERLDEWGRSRRMRRVFNHPGPGEFDFNALNYPDRTAVFVRNVSSSNGINIKYGTGGTTSLDITHADGGRENVTGQNTVNVQPSEIVVMEKDGLNVYMSVFPGERISAFSTYEVANAAGPKPHDGLVSIRSKGEIFGRKTTINSVEFPLDGKENEHWYKIGGGNKDIDSWQTLTAHTAGTEYIVTLPDNADVISSNGAIANLQYIAKPNNDRPDTVVSMDDSEFDANWDIVGVYRVEGTDSRVLLGTGLMGFDPLATLSGSALNEFIHWTTTDNPQDIFFIPAPSFVTVWEDYTGQNLVQPTAANETFTIPAHTQMTARRRGNAVHIIFESNEGGGGVTNALVYPLGNFVALPVNDGATGEDGAVYWLPTADALEITLPDKATMDIATGIYRVQISADWAGLAAQTTPLSFIDDTANGLSMGEGFPIEGQETIDLFIDPAGDRWILTSGDRVTLDQADRNIYTNVSDQTVPDTNYNTYAVDLPALEVGDQFTVVMARGVLIYNLIGRFIGFGYEHEFIFDGIVWRIEIVGTQLRIEAFSGGGSQAVKAIYIER